MWILISFYKYVGTYVDYILPNIDVEIQLVYNLLYPLLQTEILQVAVWSFLSWLASDFLHVKTMGIPAPI